MLGFGIFGCDAAEAGNGLTSGERMRSSSSASSTRDSGNKLSLSLSTVMDDL